MVNRKKLMATNYLIFLSFYYEKIINLIRSGFIFCLWIRSFCKRIRNGRKLLCSLAQQWKMLMCQQLLSAI